MPLVQCDNRCAHCVGARGAHVHALCSCSAGGAACVQDPVGLSIVCTVFEP